MKQKSNNVFEKNQCAHNEVCPVAMVFVSPALAVSLVWGFYLSWQAIRAIKLSDVRCLKFASYIICSYLVI